jgi:hypothetical protein
MKYRIQMTAVFDNTKANAIMNQVEAVKTDVFSATEYTEVEIVKVSHKCNCLEENSAVYASVDFDVAQETHSDSPSGVTELKLNVDISFTDQQKLYDFLNYIETQKTHALVDHTRSFRYFECNHDETPLIKDGSYSYIDFDAPVVTYPITQEL